MSLQLPGRELGHRDCAVIIAVHQREALSDLGLLAVPHPGLRFSKRDFAVVIAVAFLEHDGHCCLECCAVNCLRAGKRVQRICIEVATDFTWLRQLLRRNRCGKQNQDGNMQIVAHAYLRIARRIAATDRAWRLGSAWRGRVPPPRASRSLEGEWIPTVTACTH
jgi:hypothetical protein